MSKHIEEMANDLAKICPDLVENCCGEINCVTHLTLSLSKLSYRKTSDVAREIFDGVMQAIEEGTKNATSTLKQSITTHEKLLVSTGEMYSGFVGKAICQFFKKYESEGADK